MVAHNTYKELSAEAGILAIVLFLWSLSSSFKNVVEAKRSENTRASPDYRLFTQALLVVWLRMYWAAVLPHGVQPVPLCDNWLCGCTRTAEAGQRRKGSKATFAGNTSRAR
jgi:hypothetical protein